jgi:hypothetical protein
MGGEDATLEVQGEGLFTAENFELKEKDKTLKFT